MASRVNIYFSDNTKQRLDEYRQRLWGNHHSISAIVQRAVKEFLEREQIGEGKKPE